MKEDKVFWIIQMKNNHNFNPSKWIKQIIIHKNSKNSVVMKIHKNQ